ncbi:APC family permease [Streptomyces sp. R302]|uniref:APC family permease n=1 Tax=unclassified Streptomyces TaxID=2593676 RepID=UPI00145FD139|nr:MULTISPECIES: APC family permease [unclassified Streptomyces]NML54864.1 APC family permease [Streptomyces sp. R301]NML83551.1 APC family permease [Streptomyces sp. R302]
MTQVEARPQAGDTVRGVTAPGDTQGVRDKGLGGNSVGLMGGAVIGVSTVAPVYCLTSTLGPTVGEVGLQMPAIFLMGFLPMLLVAFAYRELNRALPDCGTSFTWTVKAFGPRIGWMCGWGLLIATVVVLSNLAGVATSFFWLTAGEITGSDSVAALDGNKAVHIATTLAFIAVATAISYRGITATKWVQYALVGLQLAVIAIFAFMAISKADQVAGSLDFSFSWLNPFGVESFSAFTAGLSLSIFIYWGWDACLSINEESTGSARTPGRSAFLAMVVIVASYLVVAIAVQMYAGIGETGTGLGNPDTADNVFAVLAGPIMGSGLGILLFVAVLASAAASLQTTFIPVARTALAMSTYEAFPPAFAKVHPRFKTPGRATVVAGVATGVFYAVMSLVSENVLVDTIYALGLMICFYYSITAFACVWFFRKELTSSLANLMVKGVLPGLGGLMLTAVFGKTLYDMWDPAYGSGSAVLGVGSVFVIGVGLLLLGVVLMLVMQRRSPAFFRGEILTKETPSLVVPD